MQAPPNCTRDDRLRRNSTSLASVVFVEAFAELSWATNLRFAVPTFQANAPDDFID